MLIEYAEYTDGPSLLVDLKDSVFKCCTLKGISLEGESVDATFLQCQLHDLNWYWGIFNCCLFVDTRFENCVFRGSSFAGCRFLNCEFIHCQFAEDNLCSPCDFVGSQWFGGMALECFGLPRDAFLTT